MSLDVYLESEPAEATCICAECGNAHSRKGSDQHYSSNITHNLTGMAESAGIYLACWRPEEIGITKASQMIEPLKAGLALLESDRPRFEAYNAKNGWGKYEHFIPWLREYLAACQAHPEANVRASR